MIKKLLIASMIGVSTLTGLTSVAKADTLISENYLIKDTTGDWNSKGEFIDWENKIARNRWITRTGNFFYTGIDGLKSYGFKVIEGDTYYFDSTGARTHGWELLNNKWYYFSGIGVMKRGWVLWNKNWYYLGVEGDMQVNTYVDGCHVSIYGYWNDEFEHSDINGVIYHDYESLLNGSNSRTIYHNGVELNITRWHLTDSNGNDQSRNLVLNYEGRVVRPQ